MTLLSICLGESNKDDMGILVRQIIRRYPVRVRRLQFTAWIEGDQEFLDRLAEIRGEK